VSIVFVAPLLRLSCSIPGSCDWSDNSPLEGESSGDSRLVGGKDQTPNPPFSPVPAHTEQIPSRAVTDSVTLRPLTKGDVPAALAVARALPEWFNVTGLEQMSVDLHNQMGAVAEANGEVVGFVTWLSRDGIGEIGWVGVASTHHRHGIGKRLLAFAEDRLRKSGATEVQVETLGESVDYEPYERTRAFYRAAGFKFLRSEMTDNPGMPESLWLHKTLASSSD
jgi:ribosomal protein S18 acetylase RimI-like enzyme